MNMQSVNNTHLEYIEQGRGDPVVLVHGSASDMRTWHHQLKSFADRYRVIAYSRRYHWPNQPIPDSADYSMPEHVDDLETFLRARGDEPVHVIGHSYGAFLALLLAIRRPSLVRTLVLEEPPAITLFVSNKPRPSELLRLLFSRPGAALGIIRFGAIGVAPATAALRRNDIDSAIRAFGIATLGKDAFRRLSPARRGQVRANFIKAELLGSGFAAIADDDVAAIDKPVLLLTAENSPSMFRHLCHRLTELLPDCTLQTVPDASHIMHEDNPASFDRSVLSFLAEH